LKQRYTQGYTIMVKLQDTDDPSNLDDIKTQIPLLFSDACVLQDEHKGLLYYHLDDPAIPLSKMFQIMEQAKQEFDILEDYTICDTTLEELFISFAKKGTQA